MWPAPPHDVHIILLVTFGLSGHNQLLWSVEPQLVHRGPSVSRSVPFNWANSRSCMRRKSLWPSGTSMPCLMTSLIFSTAFFTHSGLAAVINACNGSSSPGSGWPSLRPTFPSFTEPLPRIMILAPVSFSIAFNVFPRGPINNPTKLMSGCCSCGINTLSLTRTTGALQLSNRTPLVFHIWLEIWNLKIRIDLLVIGWWFEFWIHALHTYDQMMALIFQLFPGTEFTCVQALTIRTIDWLWRRRSEYETEKRKNKNVAFNTVVRKDMHSWIISKTKWCSQNAFLYVRVY